MFIDKNTADSTADMLSGEPCRCPECGEPVRSFFDHVDIDCTGNNPDLVAAGKLKPRLRIVREVKI